MQLAASACQESRRVQPFWYGICYRRGVVWSGCNVSASGALSILYPNDRLTAWILEVDRMYLGWINSVCMVLEWTLGLKGLAYCMTPGSTFSAAASVYISKEHGRLRTTRHLYETCACIINLQLHVHYY